MLFIMHMYLRYPWKAHGIQLYVNKPLKSGRLGSGLYQRNENIAAIWF